MTTAATLQKTLDTKLAELNAISVPKAPVSQAEQLEKMIAEMIEKKLSEAVAVVAPVIPEKELTVLEALNLILTGEEQNWFLNENVIGKIPSFIVTDEGKELAQHFFKGFRKYYD